MNDYQPFADDYYVNLHLNTELELPDNRETVLHYFEQMKRRFPDLAKFNARDNGDLVLEGDKESGSYRWLAIESHRLCSGYVNPEQLAEAYRQHETVLELAPHMLSLSQLDCEALDLVFGFDFTYDGNHDELVAEVLGVPPAFEGFLDEPGSKLTSYQPVMTVALDDAARLQCRIAIETRSNPENFRAGSFTEDQLSLYFTVRQFWGLNPEATFLDSFRKQREIAEEMLENRVIPRVIRPLAQAIASK